MGLAVLVHAFSLLLNKPATPGATTLTDETTTPTIDAMPAIGTTPSADGAPEAAGRARRISARLADVINARLQRASSEPERREIHSAVQAAADTVTRASGQAGEAVGAGPDPDRLLAFLAALGAQGQRTRLAPAAHDLYDELLRTAAEELAKTNAGDDGRPDANNGGSAGAGGDERFHANGEGSLGPDSDRSFGMSSERSLDANGSHRSADASGGNTSIGANSEKDTATSGDGSGGAGGQNGPGSAERLTRPQSVAFLVEHTRVNDPEGADRLAEALGDLPIALEQAAATIRLVGYPRLDDYLANLCEFLLDEPVGGPSSGDCDSQAAGDPPGGGIPSLAFAALGMAHRSVLDHLAEKGSADGDRPDGDPPDVDRPDAGTAAMQLAALALLAPSGVPRHWLHRIGLSEPIGRSTLAALVSHSVCAPSPDGRYIRIHDLQGRVLRQDLAEDPSLSAFAQGVVVGMLEGIDIEEASKGDAQRADALDMADQIRAIAGQQEGQTSHCPHEARIDFPRILNLVNNTIYRLNAMGGSRIALTLDDVVKGLVSLFGSYHRDTFPLRDNLAAAYRNTGKTEKAIETYTALLIERTRILGPNDLDTFGTRLSLAEAHTEAGDPQTAIDALEALLAEQTGLLGPDHLYTFATRHSLAGAYLEAGRLEEAVHTLEALLADETRTQGPDDANTLITRCNLAYVYRVAENLEKTIDMLEALLADQTRILGPDDPNTLGTRHNLAATHRDAGNISTAIDMYEALLADLVRLFGPGHTDTLAVQGRLADAREAARQ